MTGAMALKPGLLQGEILINLDSETEGELYVGCAGGLDASASAAYVPAEAPAAPAAGSWQCSCGATANGKFCPECGSPKPAAEDGWTCSCGQVNKGKFCSNCGAKQNAGNACPGCGQPVTPGAKFCANCGQKL